MSERFGIPDHSPPHAPDHALQNPTSQGSWGYDAGGADWPAAPAPTYGGGGAGLPVMASVDPHKNLRVAIILAMIFGPLGLFYVSFLNGAAALFVVLPVARWLALAAVSALGGRIQPVTAAIAAMWSITVPWAIIGTRWRNAKIDRETTSSSRAASPSRPSPGSSPAS